MNFLTIVRRRAFILFVVALLFNNLGALGWADSFRESLCGWWRYVKHSALIAKEVVKDPVHIAAFTASSPWVIGKVIKYAEHKALRGDGFNVLEVGAGAGDISYWLANFFFNEDCCQGWLDIVEYDPALFVELEKVLVGFPEDFVHAYCCDFAQWEPRERGHVQVYDVIISTLPITRLSEDTMNKIMKKIIRLLRPGGRFVYVSLFGARSTGRWVAYLEDLWRNEALLTAYNERLEKIDRWINAYFDQTEVVEWRNFTPMRIYIATKKPEIDPCPETRSMTRVRLERAAQVAVDAS